MSSLDEPRPLLISTLVDESARLGWAVQPHGMLAIVMADSLTIEAITENIALLIGKSAPDACGHSLATLLDAIDSVAFVAKLREPRLAALNPHDVYLRCSDGRRVRAEVSIYRYDSERLVFEFEPYEPTLEAPLYGEAQAPIERLALAPTTHAMLAEVIRDICSISGFERGVVYRFESDWQCEVVAEMSTDDDERRQLGRRFAATHVPATMRRLHLRAPLRFVSDAQATPVRLLGRDGREPASPIDLSRATLGAPRPEHLAYLMRMGSRAAMTISIIIRGRLWGLVAVHSDQPRRLGYRKRAVCELIAHMLAWQLDTRIEGEKARERARVATLHARIAATLEVDDLADAMRDASPDILSLFRAERLAVRLGSVISHHGPSPRDDDAALLAIAARLNACAENGVAVSDDRPAAIFIRLSPDGGDFVLVFRDERGSPRPWTSGDIDAALALRGDLAAHARARQRQRTQITRVDLYLGARNAQAAALIKLHDDVAAALPSRAAIVEVILEFAREQTNADGSVLEALSDRDVIYEAATGILAEHAGTCVARAGSLSGISADLDAPLLCDDSMRELERSERAECERLGVASMAVVPITLSETATVALKVVSAKRSAFSEDDIQTLKLAATNLLTALRAAQKFAALAAAESEQRTYARQLRALHAIASTTTSNRKDQIDAALRLGLEQLDLDWAYLGVIDYVAQEFVIENSVSRDDTLIVETNVRMPLGASILSRVAEAKGVHIVQDITEASDRDAIAFRGWASIIAVPLFIDEINYGAIGFTSRDARPQPFSEVNVEFVAVAGELIASAVERGRQREQLETSETRYRALTESIPEMVWVVDADNQFEYVNARWTQYTGLTLAESRRRGCEAVYDTTGVTALNEKRLADPPMDYDCEVRLRRHDGAYRWHLVRSVPFHDSLGDAGKWLITATDIEQRKSAEAVMSNVHDAALAATQAKSRFLATMSHEIRTPMNAVIGMTELLLLTQLSDEQREYIEIVRDSGQSLLRVLNDILDYSKIEAGKLELETVHFDLPGQVDSVVELLRAQYQIKGVRLTTQVDPDVPALVAGDPGRLRQILLNLAGNALKFTPEGGAVHMKVQAVEPSDDTLATINFTIEDTGIGIPPNIVERLFQPFSQGDESTTRKYGGTGLGLSICAQLVALMSGKIGVRSTPGEGSAFWFAIPLHVVKTASRAHDARKRGPVRAKPVVMRAEKILLVEDNEINTFLALKQLQRIGFIVSAVNNGQQAVDAVLREHFDLVFMDCHMPEMDGFAATREIRRLEAGGTRRLPIVAMTADARTEDHQNCLRAGMDDYVSKPTSIDSLRAVLDRWLPTPDRRQNSRGTAAPTTPAATFAVTKLLELFGDDRDAVITLLTAAAGSIKADLARIESCSAAGEYVAVAEAAHRLKGTSASIRSPKLGEVSTAVERAARAASIPPPLLVELRAAVDLLIADVERHGKLLATIG